MPVKDETYAEDTRRLRYQVHRLMQQEGLTERKALLKATPGDGNRARKLANWKEKGLWPVQESELQAYPESGTPEPPHEPSERAASGAPDVPAISEPSELSELPSKDALMAEIKAMVKAEVRDAITTIQILQTGQTIQNVHKYRATAPEPAREKGSRHYPVTRPKLAGTVDRVLLELFEAERRRRGISLSRMLDTALWHFFEKPRLSFQRLNED